MSESIIAEAHFKTDRPFDGIGMFKGRKPQKHQLNTSVISADNHLCLGGEDMFYENAPSSLKDLVPRVLYNNAKGHWSTTINGKSLYPVDGSDDLESSVEGHLGAWNVDERVKDLSAEGIDAEIAFPQLIPAFFTNKNIEMREFIMRTYNKHLAKLQRRQPGRFYGVGIANYWEPKAAAAWIKEMKADGFKVAMLPLKPGVYPDGREIIWSADEVRPMWEAFVAADMTVAFHIGETGGVGGKGGYGASALGFISSAEFRQTYGKLVFGGVLDDFPQLRIVFAEAGLHWVPGLLQDADLLTESYGTLIDYKPRLRPSEYWRRNCYATFMYDPAGLRLLDKVGADNALWSVDYPHLEGTFGYTGATVQGIVDQVGEAAAKKICGQNARQCFRL